MSIKALKANPGIILKVVSAITKKDYYKADNGAFIKTDKGKGSVTYNTDTKEITCDGLQNAIIKGTVQNDKITVQNSTNVKVAGGLGDDEFTIKYSDTVQIDGGKGKDTTVIYDNPLNVKTVNVENKEYINSTNPTVTPKPKPTTPPHPTLPPLPTIPPQPTNPPTIPPEPTPEPTTPKEPTRDGVIDGVKQGTMDDSDILSQIIAMSQTEAGAQIIKDAIVWDDENRQATVHCKGLGIDVTVSYDELEEARKNGQFADEIGENRYSSGDDDVFLLEYVARKLKHISDTSNTFTFECADNSGFFNPYTFLAGAKYEISNISDESHIRYIFGLIECNENTYGSTARIKSDTSFEVTDVNGRTATIMPNQTYAIKEVKDGLVTVINPLDSTENSPYTQTFTYDDFSKYFNLYEVTNSFNIPNIKPSIDLSFDTELSNYGITRTTADISKRNGEIEWSKQGGIGDCWCLSQINAMSYSEEGRRIIKESIVWDDENRQATVHCKGLGVDMVISYDELAEAEKNGNQYYSLDGTEYIGGQYSAGDDDTFLLEYVMTKLYYLEENGLIDFELCGLSPGPFQFLAGVEAISFINDEAEIKKFLDKLEADGGKNLSASANSKDIGSSKIVDANGKEVPVVAEHAYAIKEVKDGLVTVVNPWDSLVDSKYTMVLTYDDFCKYFSIHEYVDFSKNPDEKTKLRVRAGVNPLDYGITNISGEIYTYKRDGIIEWSNNGSSAISQINDVAFCDKGAQIIKDSILWNDENRQATVHCKGLGVDVTVSYDELENARKNSKQISKYDLYSGTFLAQDDDLFLLQYVSKKIENIKNEGLIIFDCVNDTSPESFVTFLTGVEKERISCTNESEKRAFLDRLEADGGKNLVASFEVNLDEQMNITEADTWIRSKFKIKEVKDGYVTILNSSNPTDTQAFTYDDFCKYIKSAELFDYSQPSDKTPEIIIDKNINLSDYGITVTTGILKTEEDEIDEIEVHT